jgi:hypothetical protein
VTLLAAEALGFHNSDALKPDLVQGLLHFVEFERFDDRFDFLHDIPIATTQTHDPPVGVAGGS